MNSYYLDDSTDYNDYIYIASTADASYKNTAKADPASNIGNYQENSGIKSPSNSPGLSPVTVRRPKPAI